MVKTYGHKSHETKGSYGEWKGSWEKSEWDREKINKSIFV